MSLEPIVGPVISQPLSWHYQCSYRMWLVLLWRLGMRPQRAVGSCDFSKGHEWACLGNIEFGRTILMPHELTHEQNRVAIVNSVITKIFNPFKYLTVTIQPFRKTLNHSAPVLFIVSFIIKLLFVLFSFVWFRAFVRLFSVWLFSVFFCSDSGIAFQVIWSCFSIYNNHPAVNKHHTSESAVFVLVLEARGLL